VRSTPESEITIQNRRTHDRALRTPKGVLATSIEVARRSSELGRQPRKPHCVAFATASSCDRAPNLARIERAWVRTMGVADVQVHGAAAGRRPGRGAGPPGFATPEQPSRPSG
jgi:hypothetical protein